MPSSLKLVRQESGGRNSGRWMSICHRPTCSFGPGAPFFNSVKHLCHAIASVTGIHSMSLQPKPSFGARGTRIALPRSVRKRSSKTNKPPREWNVTQLNWRLSPLLLLATCVVGCHRSEVPSFVASTAATKLKAEVRTAVETELTKQTGSYLNPKMLVEEGDTHADLLRGQAIYQQRCVQCHGVSGDGNGVSAKYMYPRPRDYRKGVFKFASTPYGYRPLREDLVRTVRQGIRGTSMPGFSLLPEQDQQAVVDYVLMLTRRGELEEQLVALADAEDAVEPDVVKDELIPDVLRRWADSIAAEVLTITPQPRFTSEHVERGKQAFLTKGCSKCHGEDGRGQTKDNRGTDVWGFPTRAADLTSGMLHGGNRPVDIYRRIYGGINGTPMPGFAIALKDEPETIWNLVAYVLSISNRRRSGEVPEPGPINPYLPVQASTEPKADEPKAE